jgi:hypothetical protein
MATVKMSEIRAKFPMYDDLSDERLLSAVRAKFYADIPMPKFAGMIDFDTKRKALAKELQDDMSPLEAGISGAGKAVADVGRGAGQWLGLVSRGDVSESRKLDAPLMDTTAGKVGNFFGNVAMIAPTAMIPGASTIPGAAAVGAITGALQPSESTAETALNIGLGGAGGAAGQKVANVAGNYVARKTAENATKQVAGAQKTAAAKAAMDAGYVIPPADLDNRFTMQAVSGLSGKIKTAQEASARNQGVTNALVRRELGVAPDAPLNVDTLNSIRQSAGQAYEAVGSTGTVQPGKAYENALDSIVAPFKKSAAGFPNAKANPMVAEIESLRSPSFDAGAAVEKLKELRSAADAAYMAKNATEGRAYKAAANALEDTLDSHLVSIGAPADALRAFRDARQLIAKTYTVQRALNSETGDVSAQVLARELTKGKPLSGNIKDAAQAGAAFPKATQALKESPKSLSPLDFGAAALALMSSGGNPLAASGLVARPLARAALLSGSAQRMALKQAGAAETPNLLARILQREPVSLPLGVLSGNALAAYLAQQ